ncbi:MAG: site-specific integrase, partial [Bacteroidales bacterium]|nr:site-specific integrase [Bacteroidales bacterium]
MLLDKNLIKHFSDYLRLEQSLSDNTINAYCHDIELFREFCEEKKSLPSITEISHHDIEDFLAQLYDLGIAASSQARILSGLKSFYRYLLQEKICESDPTLLVNTPSIGRHIPDVLSYEEIVSMIDCIDLSQQFGHRNKAIIEIMYGCGLRVSEVVSLNISDIYVNDEFVRIIGKGGKERLVPIGKKTLREVMLYVKSERLHQDIK